MWHGTWDRGRSRCACRPTAAWWGPSVRRCRAAESRATSTLSSRSCELWHRRYPSATSWPSPAACCSQHASSGERIHHRAAMQRAIYATPFHSRVKPGTDGRTDDAHQYFSFRTVWTTAVATDARRCESKSHESVKQYVGLEKSMIEIKWNFNTL